MPDGKVEIITGRERRRRWSDAEKLRIVAEAEEPGACFSHVARRNEVSRGLLWNRRAQVRRGELRPEPPVAAPVALARFAAGLKVAWSEGERRPIHRRPYVRRKPLIRPSVLDAVREQIVAWLDERPSSTAVAALERLREMHRAVQAGARAHDAALRRSAPRGDGARSAARLAAGRDHGGADGQSRLKRTGMRMSDIGVPGDIPS